jgi:ribonuclease HI
MKVDVYTDGACTYNGQKDARASYAYYFPEHKEHSSAARVPDAQPQTNNRGELLAILEATKKAQQVFPVSDVQFHIYSDSQYCKNCLTIWYSNWVAKGWKTTTGTPVINRDLIEDIMNRFIEFDSYTITYVRAHTGGSDDMSKNNHIVDRMAVEVLEPPVAPVERAKKVEGPLQLMGPPVSENELVSWIKANTDKLDAIDFKNALLSSYTKTMKKNGYNVEKQKLHRTNSYRLTAGTHLTKNED